MCLSLSPPFFFLIGKKKYIQITARCKKSTSTTKVQKRKETKRKNKKKKALITEKKRAKEKRNRVTRSESPSRSPIKKGTNKESKQLVFRSIQILKRPPIAFPPNAPHQTQRN